MPFTVMLSAASSMAAVWIKPVTAAFDVHRRPNRHRDLRTGDRGGDDDPSGALLAHVRQRRLGQREAGFHVDIKKAIEGFVVHLLDGAAAEGGGVVDHDVEPAPGGGGLIDHSAVA